MQVAPMVFLPSQYILCTRLAARRLRRRAGPPSYRVIVWGGICYLLAFLPVNHFIRAKILEARYLSCQISRLFSLNLQWSTLINIMTNSFRIHRLGNSNFSQCVYYGLLRKHEAVCDYNFNMKKKSNYERAYAGFPIVNMRKML